MSVTQLEQQLKFAKTLAEHGQMAIRLAENKQFKTLILEEFCVNECARYAQISADPALSDREKADALAMAQAAGHLRRFLSMKVQMGRQAENDMEGIRLAIDDVRAEDSLGDENDPE